VAGMLEERGAVVFDADELARRAVEVGTAGYRHVVETFGRRVLTPEGEIDRGRVAAIVFAEPEMRERLEAIVHPEVFRLLKEGVDEHRASDRVVVFDAPLLVETGFHTASDVVVVVVAPEDAQVARAVASRGLTEEEARARIAAQAPVEAKVEVADHVIRNDGTLQDLERVVDRLWDGLRRRATPGPSL
jgi:dephospho-CoA kinase